MSATTALPEPPAQTARAALEVRGLRKAYGAKTVLHGVDLVVPHGEFVALLGANGSGKSTALRCVVGLATPDGGTIHTETPAMVFQQIHLVRSRSALANVCAGGLGRLPLRQSWSTWAFPRDLREEAMACLDRVGLADRAHERAGRLSGGQQQRVAIARALCQRASVLLADEPVSALDPAASQQVLDLLRSLAHEDRIAVAAVLHQPDLAVTYADRIVGLQSGRIVLDSPAAEVDPADIGALYLPESS